MRRGRIRTWRTFNALLAEDFTFSSAAGDDHISKSTFKTQCWDTQINFMKVLIWSGSRLARMMLL